MRRARIKSVDASASIERWTGAALPARDFFSLDSNVGVAGVCCSPVETLLQVRELSIRYRAAGVLAEAVRNFSFAIAAGETVGLMGESGSGKSSVALALLGMLDKKSTDVSGSILYRSRELLALKEREFQKIRGAAISIIFQEPSVSLCPVMRAGQQIAEVIHAHKHWKWQRCRTEAEALLAQVGLKETSRIFAAYPHQLSGGQRQRVALAQALACGPELLIADEPTASLDARSQAGFIALLRELKAGRPVSILLISHTPEIQASLADRLVVMKAGELVESGSFEDIYANPKHPYTRRLLKRASASAEPAEDKSAAKALLQEQPS